MVRLEFITCDTLRSPVTEYIPEEEKVKRGTARDAPAMAEFRKN
tara:strand:- start:332 stop:463 length:132 start_codon:yes stop_codon:yes gene_type:complete